MRRFVEPHLLRAGAILLAGLAAAPPSEVSAGGPAGGLGVRLESTRTAYYPGEDLVVKLVFTGAGENEATVEAEAFARGSFAVADPDGKAPRKIDRTVASQPAEDGPLTLRGFDTGERLVNLSAWYPNLARRTGLWDISWSHGSMKAGPIRVAVIRPYRPDKDTVAVVETDLGRMTWQLLPEHAPEHVRHFVDLARMGFYDGLSIFRVVPGIEAVGGDPKGDGTGAWNNLLRPEISTKVRMGTGLVGAARRETSMTSDSMFFITLSASEYMLGKQTFYARVTDGLDVLARLHPLPSRGDTGLSDSWLLIHPVKILRVTIR